MHIICSNFGSMQPESTVSVWSTSAKPAMSASHALCGFSQDSWDVAGHVGIENEVANMSQKEQLMLKPAQSMDIATGEPIPNESCLYDCQELDRWQSIFKEGKGIYKRVMRDTHGSEDQKKAAARKASEEHAGGGYTQIWNRLCHHKIAISLVATAPPAENKDAYCNERRLLIAIYQCDPSLKGMWQDIWTSIKEIGTWSETFIYVRYPYHLGERLQKLCKVLSTLSVENHKFSAKVVTEGRAKLHHSAATQGKNQPGPEVFFYSCNDGRLYAGDQELFMHTMVGDTILALDVPFKLTFSEANEGTMLDADGGILGSVWLEV